MSQYERLPTSDPEKQTQQAPTAVLVTSAPKFAEPCQPQKRRGLAACKRFLFVSFLFFMTFSVTRRMYRAMYPTYNAPFNDASLNDDVRFCENAELIPWHGNSELVIDATFINSLVVKLKGMTRDSHVSIHSYYAEEADSLVNISIKARLSDETLQKTISIDASTEDDIFSILINTPPELVYECVKVSIDISFPSSLGTFGNLEIKVPNFDIFEHCIVNDLRFGSVNIGAVTGDIYATNLVATSITVRTVNGDIKGNFGVAEDFSVSTTNGGVNVTVAPFVNENIEAKWDLNAKSVSGDVKMVLSSPFEGRFDLYTIVGSALVSSISYPDDVHFVKQRRNEVKGYFGAPDARGLVSLTGVHGDVEVVFE